MPDPAESQASADSPAVDAVGGVVFAFSGDGVDPSLQLAGLSLVLRACLSLQKAGVDRLVVFADPGREDLLDRTLADPRIRIETSGRTTASREAARAELAPDRTWLVLPHYAIVDPNGLAALAATDIEAGEELHGTFAGARFGAQLLRPAAPGSGDEQSKDAAVEMAYATDARDEAGRRAAFYELFEACRKPVDGVVARHINRHISIAISKRLVNTPISPNMMSIFTFALGIAAAWSAAQGGYGYSLLGAVLLQTNSVLDGVDGELARVRYQHSHLGQWLDTLSDDISNWLFYGGLAIGAAMLPYGSWLPALGWIGVVASMLASIQYYVELVRVGSGDLYAIQWDFDKAPPSGTLGRVFMFFRFVVKKDFALLFFVGLALVGQLHWALFFIAGGAVGTFIATTKRSLGKLTQRER